AIDFASSRFRRVTDRTEVAMSRPVLSSELGNLGIGSLGWPDNDPPLHLVILHGDFDVHGAFSGWRSADNSKMAASHVAFVFDLRAGAPALVQTSRRGGRFRRGLGDQSLADDPREVSAQAPPATEARFQARPPASLPYGTIIHPPDRNAVGPPPIPTITRR